MNICFKGTLEDALQQSLALAARGLLAFRSKRSQRLLLAIRRFSTTCHSRIFCWVSHNWGQWPWKFESSAFFSKVRFMPTEKDDGQMVVGRGRARRSNILNKCNWETTTLFLARDRSVLTRFLHRDIHAKIIFCTHISLIYFETIYSRRICAFFRTDSWRIKFLWVYLRALSSTADDCNMPIFVSLL